MIFCFSGTGNSRWIADELALALNEHVIMITDAEEVYDINPGERVLWVYPIYSWGTPPVVRRFMKTVQLNALGEQVSHFLVCSCGDDIGLSHRMWRQDLGKLGWNAVGVYSVIMPNSYTLMKGFDVDSDELRQKKLDEAPRRVAYISCRIEECINEDDVVKGNYAWLKTRIVYPLFKQFSMSPRPFHVNDKCIGCGKCATECPLKNIEVKDKKPHWGKNCALCLRCYHTCPYNAVQYGKATRGKGQYLHPEK